MHHIQHPHPTHSGVDMTEGNITGHLIRFALPLLAGNIFQQLYNMVDTWVVGNFVSNEAFSAVGTVGPIVNMLIGCFLGFSSGAGVVISQYYGARRTERGPRRRPHGAGADGDPVCSIHGAGRRLYAPDAAFDEHPCRGVSGVLRLSDHLFRRHQRPTDPLTWAPASSGPWGIPAAPSIFWWSPPY